SISAQHRHQSLSSGPGPSNATPSNYGSGSHTQKRHSIDGQSSQHARPHPTTQPPHKARAGKWPWSELLRNPCVFSETASVPLPDPRLSRESPSRTISSHLPLPPFVSADRQPRPVSGEWRKRSSGSATSTDGIHVTPQRRASGGSVTATAIRPLTTSLSEERPPHSHGPFSGHPVAPTHATVSRSSSSSGASGGLDSDAQLSPDAAPLPPPPPSALDLLCEPDDVPILADAWTGVCLLSQIQFYFKLRVLATSYTLPFV
ncbi:hypothetical protein OESDEN_05254, partial [Oesophagostomum dentatum]